MALQAAHSSKTRQCISPGKVVASAFAGQNLHWCDPYEKPLLEWEKWLKLFTVAMMAKCYVWLTELPHISGTEQMPVLMGGLAEDATSKKVISIIFFSTGQDERTTLSDNFPTTQFSNSSLPEILGGCRQSFVM